MSEPSDVKIGPNFLAEFVGTPEWYLQELDEEIDRRRQGVRDMNARAERYAMDNALANRLIAEAAIEEAEDADVRWTFWAGFGCGIICTAMLLGAAFFVWVPR